VPSEPARWLGDLPFYRRLEQLRPLIGGEPDALRLEAVGRDVLARRSDRLEVAPVERWLGGTHLRPGHAWRWEPETARLWPG
jgi:hypothetical protein